MTWGLLRVHNISARPARANQTPLTVPGPLTSLGLEYCRDILVPRGKAKAQRGESESRTKAGLDVAGKDSSGIFKVFVAGRRQLAAAALAAGVLGIAGCASVPPGSPAKAATEADRVALVTKRAEERWALLIKGDLKAAYGYLSPGSRTVMTLERYEARTKTGNFREIRIDRVSCETDICKVRLFLTYDHRMMQGIVTPLEESWVFEGGQAWFVYRE